MALNLTLAAQATKPPKEYTFTGVSGRVYKSDHPLSDDERKQIDQYDEQFFHVGASGHIYKVDKKRLYAGNGLSQSERSQIDAYDNQGSAPKKVDVVNQLPAYTPNKPDWQQPMLSVAQHKAASDIAAAKKVQRGPTAAETIAKINQNSIRSKIKQAKKDIYIQQNQGPEAAYNNAVAAKTNTATGIRAAMAQELAPLTPQQQAQLDADRQAYNEKWLREHPGSMTDVQRAVAGADEATQRIAGLIDPNGATSKAISGALMGVGIVVNKDIADAVGRQIPQIIARVLSEPVHLGAEAITLGSSEASLGQKAGAAGNLALSSLGVPGIHEGLEKIARPVAQFIRDGNKARFSKAIDALPLDGNMKAAVKDALPEIETQFRETLPPIKTSYREPLSQIETTYRPKTKESQGANIAPPKASINEYEQGVQRSTAESSDVTYAGNEPTLVPEGSPNATQEGKLPQSQERIPEAQPPQETSTPKPPEDRGVALANRITNDLREKIGESEFPGVQKETFKQWADAAEQKGYSNPDTAHQIAQDVLSGKKEHLTKEETVGLAASLDNLDKQFESVSAKYLASAERGGDIELAGQLEDIRQKISDITQAGNKAGTNIARSLVARQAVMKADSSVAGVLARRQAAAGRELTSGEILTAKKQVEELTKLRDAQTQRIAELTAERDRLAAQQSLNSHATETAASGGSKAPKEKIAKIDAKIKDVSDRLKSKWAEAKPSPGPRASLFGLDIAAEQAARVAKIAPEILELSKLHVEKGAIKLADNVRAVVSHLKSLGIDDVSENDVAGVLAGRIRAEGEAKAPTDFQALKQEASNAFRDAAKERKQRAAFIAQKTREAQQAARTAQRTSDLAKLAKERAALQAEDKAAREAEKAFWKEVNTIKRSSTKAIEGATNEFKQGIARRLKKDQAAFDKAEAAKRAAERRDYQKWWREKGSQYQKMIEHFEKEEALAPSRAAREKAKAEKLAVQQKLRADQAAFMKNERLKASLDRRESIARWKASVQGKRAQSMNAIDRLQEQLDFYDQTGQKLGAKSDLPEPHDKALFDLRVKEAALRNRMDQVTREMQARSEFDKLSPAAKFVRKWNPWNVQRSIVASFDDSFPLNQGALTLFSDPKSWLTGFKSSLRGFSEKGYESVLAEIRADPKLYDRATAAGLLEKGANLEDIFGSNVISKIPGIKQSEQMYEAGADALRFDLFNRWADMAEAANGGKPLSMDSLKALAKEVKTWTGQGDWGKGLQGFSKPFFALRYRMSQFETLMGAPLWRTIKLGRETGEWGAAKVILRKYAQAAATMTVTAVTLDQALRNLGPTNADGSPQWYVELRPNATDFGRIVHKVGNTSQSFDLLPPAVRKLGFFTRMVSGKRISISGNEQDASTFMGRGLRTEMLGQEITNGLHPVPAAIWAYLNGQSSKDQTYFGKSQDFTGAQAYEDLGISSLPISIQAWKELWENPDLSTADKIAASSLIPFVGSNVNTTPETKKKT